MDIIQYNTLVKPIFILLIILAISGLAYINSNKPSVTTNPTTQVSPSPTPQNTEEFTVIAKNLDTPWAVAFLPDKSILVTERFGRVNLIDSSGNLTPIATLTQVKEIGEGGLLGITLHPDFSNNHFVYLYYTYQANGNDTLNRVVRMTYLDQKLSDEKIIVDKIPGASNHNGGRLKFGPDKLLYITTGDASEPSLAQDKNSLAGKILRVSAEGKVEIYSYGHRNPQGIAWDSSGKLWETEHGRSGAPSGLDEINLIQQGKNYGWPTIQGDEKKEGMETSVKNSGSTTWAPAGAAFIGNSLFFGGLRGQTLYEAVTENNQIADLKEHFKNQFGRIRDVVSGPDGMLYITTSNKDGRGNPASDDDKIIKINLMRKSS